MLGSITFFCDAIYNSVCIKSFTNFARTKIDHIDSVSMLSFVVHWSWLMSYLLERYGKVVPPPTTTPMSSLERIMPYSKTSWLWKLCLLQLQNFALIITYQILYWIFQLLCTLISLKIKMSKLLYFNILYHVGLIIIQYRILFYSVLLVGIQIL